MERSKVVPAVQLSVRAGLAALLSVGVAQYFGLNLVQPLITACLVIDLSPEDTRRFAVKRFAGTVLGVLIGASLGALLPSNAFSVGFGVLVAMLASHLLRLDGAVRLAGFVCGICLLQHSGTPWSYGYARLLETTLGIVMAVLTSYVPKLMRAEPSTLGN